MEPSAYKEFRELEDRHWWFRGRKSLFRDLVLRLCRRHLRSQGLKALDLGCGMGAMMPILAEAGATVFGTDVSVPSLEHCKGRGFESVFRSYGNRLPLPESELDLIVAFDTLEHIQEERETLDECFRVLRPGGLLILSVPAYQFLFTHQDRVVHHQRRYTRSGLRRRLEAAGFETIKASYINFFLFPLILPIVLLIKLKEALFPPAVNDSRSNVGISIPGWMNEALYRIFASERYVLRVLSVPLGHSLVVAGRRPREHAFDHR
ncbi:MAG TPA: class I SAM-dependent methyltransferase [Planctomycetota bacterium]|nr:class I SAM-dependent methyltransferase [Planctomycetota bacterium]